MATRDDRHGKRVDRRTFLRGGIIAGGALAGAGLAIKAVASATGDSATGPDPDQGGVPTGRLAHTHRTARPNILVIIVDQLRYPQWFSAGTFGLGFAPHLQSLREGAVSFGRHYTASNDCTPSRAALLTGLYTHQTGCMITGGSTLDEGFPTWGTMLRHHGYHTHWFGKWHLTHGDNHWTPVTGDPVLERYGFAGGVYPSPDGAPGQGWRVDPYISNTFTEWFAQANHAQPWCTTVSFVNPHDIAWWYVWSDRVPAEASALPLTRRLPPNFETPEHLAARRKPRLQHSFQAAAAASFGPVPFEGPEVPAKWLEFQDLYVKLQRVVDHQIGQVLHTLHSRPDVAANTVIVFTSDHGEYGASHGLRGKGASAYEEAIRVPLIVKDPRKVLTAAPAQVRTQLTSSVDIAPLLLTIGSGSSAWREDKEYAHLAKRLDLAKILSDPGAPGRDYVLHATDEIVTEYAIEPYAADAPLHVIAVRTAAGKYATYSNWTEDGIAPVLKGQEGELYDYTTQSGRLELHNGAGESVIESPMRELYDHALKHELRAKLPPHLQDAHARGFTNYFLTARRAAEIAIERRRRHAETDLDPGPAFGRAPFPAQPGQHNWPFGPQTREPF
jgi:arylsulfatase A-like enzyme